MTNTHLTHPDTQAPSDQEPRRRTGFDDEIARLIRERVQSDLAKRHARRQRNRQQACHCAQPRPPALLARDPCGGTSVLTLCPVCGRST
jgi:hypothetical protein